MPDFVASFEDGYYHSFTNMRYFDYTKDEAIRLAKAEADRRRSITLTLYYMHSGKSVGTWVKKGSRWYRE